MGFFSDVCSAIGSAISSVCSSLGGALGGVAALASALIPGVGLPEILLAVNVICSIVSAVAEALGLKKDEKMEEFGMAAENADLKPEDFDSTEEYIEYLRDEVKKLDKEEVENLSNEDRAKYQAVGAAITIKGIEEKYGMSMPAEFWNTAKDMELKGEEVKTYMDTFKKNGIEDMGDMAAYLKGEETKSDAHAVSDSMMEALSEMYPDLSREELDDKLTEMENKVKEIE